MGWGDPFRLDPSSEQILPVAIQFFGSPLRFVESKPGFGNSPRPAE